MEWRDVKHNVLPLGFDVINIQRKFELDITCGSLSYLNSYYYYYYNQFSIIKYCETPEYRIPPNTVTPFFLPFLFKYS